MARKVINVLAWLGVALLMAASDGRAAGVVFSELMYNPLPSATNAADDDQFEFLELRNTSASPVNLSGATFTSGITFTFPTGTNLAAGAYGLLVRSVAAMTNRYGALTNILGVYTGKLANEGEQVTLRKSDGTVLYSVTYGDTFPWPEAADGHGASLVLADTNGNPDAATSWSFSDTFQGTPGRAGAAWTPTVVVNELLAHTDFPQMDSIELLNTSTQSLSVLGWTVSDDAVQRAKYRITNTAAIAPGGFLVLTTNQFDNPASAASNRFALSELGETLYLTSSNLVRFADYVKFGASENGVSLGRSPDGWGGFTFMVTNTVGASNGVAKVGPVVISEIMYHPASDNPNEEYVELLNITGTAVPLYDAARPTNTWKLASAVDYTFPTNVTMAAGSRMLVTGATNLTVFRATYNVPTNIPVYGAWTGALDNAGESVRLYKPGIPETNGFVPQILVDRVDYLDAAPWPTAPDGNGPSLERLVATNVANTVSNWFVGAPGGSPGVAPVGGFFNPQVMPAAPAVLQAFTVTVAVVAQPLPTQVVCRTVIDGVTTNRLMNDAGVAGDAAAGDQVYTAVIAGRTNATWVYYAFDGYAASGTVFNLPVTEVAYNDAPTVTLKMCNGGLAATVLPVPYWASYSITGLVTDADCFQVYLNGAGEALLDDVYVVDGGGTNHLGNSAFTAALQGSGWNTNSGNHQASTREIPWDEGGNGVLHVRAAGPGNVTNFADSLSAYFTPPMQVATPAALYFRVRQVGRQVPHWFWVAVGSVPADVVLNEVMYHPAQTNEADGEYVELFNPAGVAVDVSGWEVSGAGFTMPEGTWIGPTGYLVCAANAAAITALYGVTNVVGNWTGTLQNDGETLALRNAYGRELDRLTYDDRQPWPVAADGCGPALERINCAVANESYNWASATAETNWQSIVWTTQISAVNSGVIFHLDYEGKCLVDGVSVKAVGSGVELATNGGFESGESGWSKRGNHAQSRVEAGVGYGGGNAIVVVGNYSRWVNQPEPEYVAIRYGDAVSNCVASAPLWTMTGTNYVLAFRVRRSGLGERLWVTAGGFTNSVTMALSGTPGRANSVVATSAPPGVLSVTTDHDLISTGVANVVRARIAGVSGITNVSVAYRMVVTNGYEFSDELYAATEMKDDGVAPDGGGGDGEFAAVLPPVTEQWTLVRYHVDVLATNGLRTSSPRRDDPSQDYAYFVGTGYPQTNIGNWIVFVDNGTNPVVYPVSARACAVSPEGQCFTDVRVRHRGRPSSSAPANTGLALRMNQGRLLNSWFARNQEGINFRKRGESPSVQRRILNEVVAYDLFRIQGFPVPRCRHVCLWLNGSPTVTVEMEDPEEDFLKGNDISSQDYVSRAGYTGRRTVGGDAALDNFAVVKHQLTLLDAEQKEGYLRSNLWVEAILPTLSLLAATSDGDQYFDWNMFQQRGHEDGRWQQYPWDLDMCFSLEMADTNVFPYYQTTNLHPYYQTPLHPGVYQTNLVNPGAEPLGSVLFHPETGAGSEYTLPYRHRHQMTLWRHMNTLFATNVLFSRLDAVVDFLVPIYSKIGLSSSALTNQLTEAKTFIVARRDFLINGTWSDKNPAIWNPTNVYAPTNVVINEIMPRAVPGGEYLELYNRGACAVDLSHWLLTVSNESYRLPMGTMLGAASYLVVADTQMTLTNTFNELAPAMVRRYVATPIWDWPVVWTSATEYASRVVEVPQITLPDAGATITLRDLLSNVVDTVTYGAVAPWPTGTTAAIELVDPATNNAVGAAWQSSRVVGTPGWVNSVAADQDGDTMPDAWEQRIVEANGGDLITNVQGVVTNGDFDGDGVLNGVEYVAGLDPTVDDADQLSLSIRLSNSVVVVEFGTIPPTGEAYWSYDARLYTLDQVTNLMVSGSWTNIPAFTDLVGGGQVVVYTNGAAGQEFYRYRVRLRDRR